MKGEAPGVKTQGGILEQLLREVEIECLPGDIPGHMDADISNLMFGQVIRVPTCRTRAHKVHDRREPAGCPRGRR